ncbi:MAG: PilZ domain-containing protein [Alphaproteobacteria bacterium]
MEPRNRHDERRLSRRASVLLEARITEGSRQSACLLFNVSEGGAMLRVADPFNCPTTIALDIPRIGRVNGHVTWRGVDALGVAFHDSPRDIARRFAATVDLEAAA